MKRIIASLVLLACLISGCTPAEQASPSTFERRNPPVFNDWFMPDYFIPETVHVIGLGDSLTQGVGDERKRGGYFGRLTERMASWKGVKDIDEENLAKRGRRSDQLIKQLEKPEIQDEVKKADVIYMTIGGNDIMKVVKANLFNLRAKPFYEELGDFENRLDEIYNMIRGLNGDAVIVVSGLYNPLTLVTDEENEFDTILEDWNEAIEMRAIMDGKTCYVPVKDLFVTNENMVYHTDFFHPNAAGYDNMAARYIGTIQKCGLSALSDGKLDIGE